jgi:hypothetical protein
MALRRQEISLNNQPEPGIGVSNVGTLLEAPLVEGRQVYCLSVPMIYSQTPGRSEDPSLGVGAAD